jgi:hypothetical protein
MKKIVSVLALAFLFSMAISSCKSHGGCAAYSKADVPVKNSKSI